MKTANDDPGWHQREEILWKTLTSEPELADDGEISSEYSGDLESDPSIMKTFESWKFWAFGV